MATFLYTFGFESPGQMRQNERYDSDDEDSNALLIDAEDEAAALVWGREIAERFVKLMFRDDRVSWKELKYADKLETGKWF